MHKTDMRMRPFDVLNLEFYLFLSCRLHVRWTIWILARQNDHCKVNETTASSDDNGCTARTRELHG
jgi:hypothetical protein